MTLTLGTNHLGLFLTLGTNHLGMSMTPDHGDQSFRFVSQPQKNGRLSVDQLSVLQSFRILWILLGFMVVQFSWILCATSYLRINTHCITDELLSMDSLFVYRYMVQAKSTKLDLHEPLKI